MLLPSFQKEPVGNFGETASDGVVGLDCVKGEREIMASLNGWHYSTSTFVDIFGHTISHDLGQRNILVVRPSTTDIP